MHLPEHACSSKRNVLYYILCHCRGAKRVICLHILLTISHYTEGKAYKNRIMEE